MKEIKLFCFGFGQVAKNFVKKLNSENFTVKLFTTSRNKSSTQKFGRLTYSNLQFDNNIFDPIINEQVMNSDHILISIPPINGEDLVIKNFSKIIENSNSKWVTYLSATSVYGDHKGEWVNEDSPTKPTSYNGIERLRAENLWMNLYSNNKLPLQIFRLSGIYSNEGNILSRLKSGNVKIVNKKNHFFSRIHVEDIANILFESLLNFKPGEVYNISDDKPATSEAVTLYGAKLLSMNIPKRIEIKDIESEMLKNFYKDSKKVSNEKLKKYFKYNLKFPTYIEGLNFIKNNII
tara:strand:+ start:1148 stop:2023 length:876 start_codon:yes stop_codon:yes gene_type:complete